MANSQKGVDRHKLLTEQGWVRRFTAEEPRLTEMKNFYETLGLEVMLEPGASEEGQECSGCFDVEGFSNRYKTIYTKDGEQSSSSESDDMFE